MKKENALEKILKDYPDVFNHNLETVPRLYLSIRPGARYFNSLKLLNDVKDKNSNIFTKSGLMLGLGEKKNEIMHDWNWVCRISQRNMLCRYRKSSNMC